MRIAVCGTHGSGKTTLVEEFLRSHPEFAHEPEPYTVLVEDYGEEFSAEPGAEDFYRQLVFNVDRLQRYPAGERVIFERSPVDFLAYLLALQDLQREDVESLSDAALQMIRPAIRNLDLIVFLPLDKAHPIQLTDAEDLKLRRAVDARLVAILADDEFDVLASGRVAVIEARGSTAQRLRMVEAAMEFDRLVVSRIR